MVQCLYVGDGEHSCLHSRHGGMPFWGCDNSFAGMQSVPWPSQVERATNFIPRLQQKPSNNQPRPDEQSSSHIGDKCLEEEEESGGGIQPFHKAWKKKEKERDLINYVSL